MNHSYGPVIQARSKHLFETLIRCANNQYNRKVMYDLEKSNETFIHVLQAQNVTIEELIQSANGTQSLGNQDKILGNQDIKEILTHYFPVFLEILEDTRLQTQGCRWWFFRIQLWHSAWEEERNLEKFDIEWARFRKLKAASSPDPKSDSNRLDPAPKSDYPPFIAGSPIQDPRNFFGRQREIRIILNLFKYCQLQHAAIIGPKRSGKTSFLRILKAINTSPKTQFRSGQRDNLPRLEGFCWIYVDFQDSSKHTQQELLKYLLQSMELQLPETVCDLGSFMEIVRCNLQKPTVILMDEIGKAISTVQS